jgi:hypothetical protein
MTSRATRSPEYCKHAIPPEPAQWRSPSRSFIGRGKDVIRRRGDNVAPAEIEEVLMSHPDVLDAAVGRGRREIDFEAGGR